MAKLDKLIGKTFWNLTIIERIENYEGEADSRAQYLAKCSCGNTEKIIARYLKRGDKKSCSKCHPKRGGKGHNGSKKYWGENKG